MRKLVVSEFLTLDGVMQAPGDPNEDRSGGFEHGGWQLAFFDDAFGKFVMEGFADAGAFLLGRLTYENFVGADHNILWFGEELAGEEGFEPSIS
jgi:hypothetical protein